MTALADRPQFLSLARRIAPRGKLLKTWPLSGGISAQMTGLEIEQPGGRIERLVLRRPGSAALSHNPAAAAEEYRLLETLHTLGIAVPRPFLLDSSGDIFPQPYLVIGYLAGEADYAPQNPAAYGKQLARQLARIHGVDLSLADFSFLPGPPVRFDQICGSPPYGVDPIFAVERIARTLEAARHVPPRNPACLLHGDYWPGNLLWQDGKLAAVVDWEDARVGDPLADLAITRLDLLWIVGQEAMQAFTRRYLALAPVDIRHLPLWDLCAALRLARLAGDDLEGWAAFFHPYGRPEITPDTIREHYRSFVSRAFHRLESKKGDI